MDNRPPEQPDGAKAPRADSALPRARMSGTPGAGVRRDTPGRPVLAGDLAGAHIDAPVNLVRD